MPSNSTLSNNLYHTIHNHPKQSWKMQIIKYTGTEQFILKKTIPCNRPDIMVIDKKRKTHIPHWHSNTEWQKCCWKGRGKERKIYTTGHGSQRTMATGKSHNYPVNHISHWHHIKKLYRKPSETGPTKIHPHQHPESSHT